VKSRLLFILKQAIEFVNEGSDMKKLSKFLTVSQSRLYVPHTLSVKWYLLANQLSTFHGNVG